jgi:hypothetical protein
VLPNTAAGSSSPVPPGTYSISGNSGAYFVRAGLAVTDANCNLKSITSDASDGSIEIISVTPMLVTGRFDLTFPSGDHLTGQFAAPVCDFDLNALSQNGLTGCGSSDGGGGD